MEHIDIQRMISLQGQSHHLEEASLWWWLWCILNRERLSWRLTPGGESVRMTRLVLAGTQHASYHPMLQVCCDYGLKMAITSMDEKVQQDLEELAYADYGGWAGINDKKS